MRGSPARDIGRLLVSPRSVWRLIPMEKDEIHLGRFQFDLRQRTLKCDGASIRLGSRALDILWVLASSNGDVVSKDELMARVWPGLVVEENNIQVHIAALRRALDPGKNGHSYVVMELCS